MKYIAVSELTRKRKGREREKESNNRGYFFAKRKHRLTFEKNTPHVDRDLLAKNQG